MCVQDLESGCEEIDDLGLVAADQNINTSQFGPQQITVSNSFPVVLIFELSEYLL
ncbi:hypothetical protein HanOQP8_Chr09g0309881 [Helianthus annuus]|nr:hypothetical protein HanOQP8_Chr09g0309881 [Helianthus annuus]